MKTLSTFEFSKAGEIAMAIVCVPLALMMTGGVLAWFFFLPAVGALWMLGWLR